MKSYEHIRVVLKDLPVTIRGFASDDGFGYYTIIINSRLSNQMQIDTYEHELSHIANGDFLLMRDANRDTAYDADVNTLEINRHK